jgi:hypothetical protein
MAFPILRSTRVTLQATNSTSWSLVYPTTSDITDSGTNPIEAGDLILILVGRDGTGTTSAVSGYTRLLFNAASGQNAAVVFAKVADGTESGTIAYTTTTEQGAARFFVYKNWFGDITNGVEVGGVTTGSGTSADPASFGPSWGLNDNMWLAFLSHDSGSIIVTGFPANFGDSRHDVAGGATGAGLATASLDSAVATLDAGPFTLGSEQWATGVIAIRGSNAIAVSITESSATADIVDATVSGPIPADQTDSTPVSDTSTGTLTASASVTESSPSADIQTATISTSASITESSPSAETQSGANSTSASITESSATADTQNSDIVFVRTITESSATGDTQAVTLTASRSLTESSATADIQTSTSVRVVSITEQTPTQDTAAYTNVIVASITESTPTSDTYQYQSGTGVSITESGAPRDIQTSTASFTVSIIEQAGCTDNCALPDPTGDGTGAQDLITASVIRNVSITESSATSDSSARFAAYVVSANESSQTNDILSYVLSSSILITESTGCSDVVQSQSDKLGDITESVGLTDTAVGAKVVVRRFRTFAVHIINDDGITGIHRIN